MEEKNQLIEKLIIFFPMCNILLICNLQRILVYILNKTQLILIQYSINSNQIHNK